MMASVKEFSPGIKMQIPNYKLGKPWKIDSSILFFILTVMNVCQTCAIWILNLNLYYAAWFKYVNSKKNCTLIMYKKLAPKYKLVIVYVEFCYAKWRFYDVIRIMLNKLL